MTRLKIHFSLFSAALVALLLFATVDSPRAAAAHPLGNFSINRLALIDLDSDGAISLRYVVDAAEIPTFQKLNQIDADGDGRVSPSEEAAYLEVEASALLANLELIIEGARVVFALEAADLELLAGQGGLQTSRIVVDASGRLPPGWPGGAAASFRDRNHAGGPGWRQVVVTPGAGVQLLGGDAATTDLTSQLTAYPEKLLKSPPAVSAASFRFSAGDTVSVVGSTAAAAESPTVSRQDAGKTLTGFASIVTRQNITPAFAALALVLAAGWGAMHALSPGHGKTVVAAYLIGERGSGRHAIYLGLIVTATHTISVFALGAVAIFASSILTTDTLFFWLSAASGVMVALLGSFLLVTRLRSLLKGRHLEAGRTAHAAAHDHSGPFHEPQHHQADHESTHPEHHAAEHHSDSQSEGHRSLIQNDGHGASHHSHLPSAPGWRGLVALGVSGGLVPCPTALIVMLSAIAIDRVIYGLILVTAFSAGLAGVLTAVGLVLVYGRQMISRSRVQPLLNSGLGRRLALASPLLSALAIMAAGVLLTGQAML